jgi:hypothetical protein
VDKLKEERDSRVPMAHACHSSYLGGRDQEDRGKNSAEYRLQHHQLTGFNGQLRKTAQR